MRWPRPCAIRTASCWRCGVCLLVFSVTLVCRRVCVSVQLSSHIAGLWCIGIGTIVTQAVIAYEWNRRLAAGAGRRVFPRPTWLGLILSW